MTQELINIINQQEKEYSGYADPQSSALIQAIAKVAREEAHFDTQTLDEIFRARHWYANSFLSRILNQGLQLFSEKDVFIKELIAARFKRQISIDAVEHFISNKLSELTQQKDDGFIEFLKESGATIEYILASPFKGYSTQSIDQTISNRYNHYMFTDLPKKAILLNRLVQRKIIVESKQIALSFLLGNAPEKVTDLKMFFYDNHIDLATISVALKYGNKYEKDIIEVYNMSNNDEEKFNLAQLLAENLPEKYSSLFEEAGEKILVQKQGNSWRMINMTIDYLEYLYKKDKALSISKAIEYAKNSSYTNYRFINFVDGTFGQDGIDIYPHLLLEKKDTGYHSSEYFYSELFDAIEKYDFSGHLDSIFVFGSSQNGKIKRTMASDALAKYVDQVTPQALELLKGKVNDRIFGAIVLQHSKDVEVLNTLSDLLDTEKSDDPRDFIIEALREMKYGKQMTITEAKEMIAKAESRKKLNKWNEKWLLEEEVPTLFWNDGTALDENEMRFLFYRGKRSKGLELDIEAKQVAHLLDKEKALKFAKYLIQKFKESNADNKFKHYTLMAAVIGGEKVLDDLMSLFRYAMTNKRFQFAAKLIGSIALIGNDKALRFVEMLSRKYATKRAQIGETALQVLDDAAKELNIDRDELSDRIIPNFGFEDGYLTFQAGEDEYRAFINKEFIINYFNEDNKLRKSVPKDTDKDFKKELKEIQKEIKATVKAQSGRLELYLVNERKWEVEKWQKYYIENPIMLIYVQKLLWGVYSPEGKLKEIFYCDEDLEFYNAEADEVEFSEGDLIGIVHPLQMTPDQRKEWKEWAFDNEFEFEFEIINRETPRPIEDMETEKCLLLSGKDIPRGADYVAGFLEKRGWGKESSDGGSLDFYKQNKTLDIVADVDIEGPAAFYQGGTEPAKIHSIYFRKASKRSQKVKLKDVPEVFFSELIYDLKALINA